MNIEEAEEKFGCRWNKFTPEQQIEIVKSISTPDELDTPLICNLLMMHLDHASNEMKQYVRDILKKRSEL